MSAAVAAAAAAVVVPVAAAFGALPVNPDLPVSFGVNSRGGVRYERETFASLADDVVVCRIRASEPGTLGFTARIVPPWKNHAATAERDRLVYRAHDVAARYIAG